MKKKTEKIQIWVTPEQKNQLRRMANFSQKSLTEYLISAGLSTKDTTKIDESVNVDLTYLKKSQLVLTRLLLQIGAKQLGGQEILNFYNEAVIDADQQF